MKDYELLKYVIEKAGIKCEISPGGSPKGHIMLDGYNLNVLFHKLSLLEDIKEGFFKAYDLGSYGRSVDSDAICIDEHDSDFERFWNWVNE